MARCPRCTRHFRVMEDEQNMHDCPHCGYGESEPLPICLWCATELADPLQAQYPYCSTACAIAAERDSQEDEAPNEN